MKKLFFIVFAITISINLFSQQVITGYVFDRETKEPLVGANLFFRSSHQGAVTHANGQFIIPPSRIGDTLEVSFIGYDRQLLVNPSPELDHLHARPATHVRLWNSIHIHRKNQVSFMKYFFYIAFLSFFAGCRPENSSHMISSPGSAAESVYLTHDQHNNPVVVWTEKQGEKLMLFFAISTDDGRSFSKKVNLSLTPDVATHPESMPKAAFKDDETILVAYEKKSPTKENKYAGAIYYVVSNDEGKTWTPEKFLHNDTVAGRSRSYFDIERLPDGEIGASWLDIKLNNETGGRSVRFAKTTQAKGFSNEILVDSSACQCCRIDVYSDSRSNIFVAYRGLKKGEMGKQIRDMMIATSTNGGSSFSSPVTISADNWNIDGCPHTGPSLCSNKAGLFSLWYTEGTGTGIYYAQRSQNTQDFSPRQLVSNNGRHPQLTANNNRIAMLWEETVADNGKPNTMIHYRIVKDGVDIEKNTLTTAEVNAFSPVVTQTKDGFLAAYLVAKNNKVAVYIVKI